MVHPLQNLLRLVSCQGKTARTRLQALNASHVDKLLCTQCDPRMSAFQVRSHWPHWRKPSPHACEHHISKHTTRTTEQHPPIDPVLRV